MALLSGIAATNGKYVLFFGGDDYFVENAFVALYNAIEKNLGFDI